MSWNLFILRYVGVIVKIYLEIKNFPKIMYHYNFTAANFLHFLQMLLKGILKLYNMNIWFLYVS